jgi:hypothetical protein
VDIRRTMRLRGTKMSNQYAEGDAYLQIRRDNAYGRKCRVMKSTQRQPEIVEPGCVVVKVRIRIPIQAFAPLQPEAVVTIPDSLVQHAVDVEAVDPS